MIREQTALERESSENSAAIAGGRVGDQLATELRAFALEQEEGTPIASSRSLAAQYGVSMGTVQRTIRELVKEGLLYAEERRGYFVAQHQQTSIVSTVIFLDDWRMPDRPYCLGLLRGMSAEAERRGFRLEVKPFRGCDVDALCKRPDAKGLIAPWPNDSVKRAIRDYPDLRIVYVEYPTGTAGAGGAVVTADGFATGKLGMQFLRQKGCRRVYCVDDGRPLLAGAKMVVKEADGIELRYMRLAPTDICGAAVEEMRQFRADGLLSSDDYVAARIVEGLREKDPQLAASLEVAAHANRGEDVLPKNALRLEIDALEIGATAVRTLEWLCDSPKSQGISINVSPHYIEPEQQ